MTKYLAILLFFFLFAFVRCLLEGFPTLWSTVIICIFLVGLCPVPRAAPRIAAVELAGEPAQRRVARHLDPLDGPHRAEPVQEPLYRAGPAGMGWRVALELGGPEPEPQPPRR